MLVTPEEAHRRAAEAQRIVDLLDALADLPDVAKDIERREPKSGYERRVLEIGVHDTSEAGSECELYIAVDLETAGAILGCVEFHIKEALRRAGVEPE